MSQTNLSEAFQYHHHHHHRQEVTPLTIESLLNGIAELSRTLRAILSQATFPKEHIWYSDKVYYLQRNILDIAHGTNENQPLNTVRALVALIYCARCLRDVPFTFTAMGRAVTRLKSAVLRYEEQNSWEANPESARKIFWILCFGGAAAIGKPERTWFAARFRASCDYLDVNDWETARSLLQDMLWEPDLDEAGYEFWMEAIIGDF